MFLLALSASVVFVLELANPHLTVPVRSAHSFPLHGRHSSLQTHIPTVCSTPTLWDCSDPTQSHPQKQPEDGRNDHDGLI